MRTGPCHPPALGTWLLRHLSTGYCRDELVGDLLEEYQVRRSALWFWREVGGAVLHGAYRACRVDVVPILQGLLGSWAALIVCLWCFDTLQGEWRLDYHMPASLTGQAARWGSWLVMLGLAHGAAGGILARVSRRHVYWSLSLLVLSLLDWKLPIVGRLMYHTLNISRHQTQLLPRVAEFAVALLALWIGLRLALRRPHARPQQRFA